jgi:hypothetical protein
VNTAIENTDAPSQAHAAISASTGKSRGIPAPPMVPRTSGITTNPTRRSVPEAPSSTSVSPYHGDAHRLTPTTIVTHTATDATWRRFSTDDKCPSPLPKAAASAEPLSTSQIVSRPAVQTMPALKKRLRRAGASTRGSRTRNRAAGWGRPIPPEVQEGPRREMASTPAASSSRGGAVGFDRGEGEGRPLPL